MGLTSIQSGTDADDVCNGDLERQPLKASRSEEDLTDLDSRTVGGPGGPLDVVESREHAGSDTGLSMACCARSLAVEEDGFSVFGSIRFLGQLGTVGIFILLGSGQTLAVRASEGEDGEFPYDTAAAVTCAEALKLIVSVCWVVTKDLNVVSWPPPRTWFSESCELSFIAALFALQNEVNYLVIDRLGVVLFTLLGNLKIVFTCIFMGLLLGKKFAVLQWVAVVLLTLSSALVKAPDFASLNNGGFSQSTVVGILLVLLSGASSGLAAVKNEVVLKRGAGQGMAMPFMLKNGVLYCWGVALNFFSWSMWGSHSFFDGFDSAVLVSIICAAGMGLAIAVMLRYLDNVVRCFSGVCQVMATVVLSRLLPGQLHTGSFDTFYAISLALLVGALVLYQEHQSPKLPVYITAAVAVALAVGLTCHCLDAASRRSLPVDS